MIKRNVQSDITKAISYHVVVLHLSHRPHISLFVQSNYSRPIHLTEN